jgi:hypothetical protein
MGHALTGQAKERFDEKDNQSVVDRTGRGARSDSCSSATGRFDERRRSLRPQQNHRAARDSSELNEFKRGDYYAPSKTVVQQPTFHELNQIHQGDYCAP